jgi:hypothetical protein
VQGPRPALELVHGSALPLQSPQLSPLVARSHRNYNLADPNTHSVFVNPCQLRQEGGDLEWLAVITQYVGCGRESVL